MNICFLRISLPLLLLLPVLAVGGCMRPDTLPIFESDQGYQEQAAPEEAFAIPEDLLPGFVDEMDIAMDSGIVELTVEEAIQMALRHNRDLRIEQINPLVAGAFEAIERGVYDPELFGELTFAKDKKSEANAGGGRDSVEDEERSGIIGLRQKLPSGTALEAAVEQSSTAATGEADDDTARVGLSITQALLRGFGPLVNLATVRRAALDTDISRYELRGFTEALLAETESAYWDYVLDGRKIDIFEKSLAVARQQLDEIKQRIEVGVLPRIEAAAAKAEVARREQALIDVRSSLEASRLHLLRLINPGREDEFDIRITATSTVEVNPSPIDDLLERLQLARQARPELNEARLRLRQNRLTTITTANGLLPRLDLFITLGKSGYAASFSDSFKDLDGNNNDFSAGIRLSHYLNNRAARGRDLAARAGRRQAREAVENLQQLVDLDVRLAMNEFERSRRQIAATRVTRLLQEETLNAEKERFDVGASTALLVAQAQRDHLSAAIDEAEAVINCRKALISLYLAEGSLLEHRGVSLSDSSR